MITSEPSILRGRCNFIDWLLKLAKYSEVLHFRDILTTDHHPDERAKARAMETIYFLMEDSERTLIENSTTPYEMLCKLARHYYPRTMLTRAQIRADIESTKHDGVGKTVPFVNKIRFHFKELRVAGCQINDDELMTTMLHKLHHDFAPVKQQLNQCRSLSEFQDILLDFDIKLRNARDLKEYEREKRIMNQLKQNIIRQEERASQPVQVRQVPQADRSCAPRCRPFKASSKCPRCYLCGTLGHKQYNCQQQIILFP